MRFQVLDAHRPAEFAAWIGLWRAWPHREVMGHPAYAQLFARPCDRVVCVAGEDRGGSILFPLVLRPLAAEPWSRPGERRWDALTPYGYGGPFAWGSAARDDEAFWRCYLGWCRDERLVTTFLRLSLFPDQLARLPWATETRSTNIVVSVRDGPEALWRGYEKRVRKWVRIAEAAGVEVQLDRDASRLDAFLAVYDHTMRRRQADAWYFFPRTFFEAIRDRLPGQYAFFHALSRGEVVSSDLYLCSEQRIYSFLGGTQASAFPQGVNYLLKHRSAVWAAREGKRECVLGGGYEPRDGVFLYKRAFVRRGGEVPFKVASGVHDEHACRELAADRAAFAARNGHVWIPRPGFFPPYRS
jgi:hypothetical protein